LRRLKGGISTRTFEASYTARDGSRKQAVLRLYVPENYNSDAESVEREYRTLEVLAVHGVPAPRPLLLDAGGEHFGVPCMVVSRLPGRPPLYPRSWHLFLARLAEALASVHRLTPDSAGLSHLIGVTGHSNLDERLSRPLHEKLQGDRLAEYAWSVLRERLNSLAPAAPALVHDDFWPGNTVWYRGRLSGVVDWGSACIGDLRADVAQCRVDLTLMYGAQRARQFAEEYEALAGPSQLHGLWFWDAYLSLHALASLEYYVDGYFDMGLPDQSIEQRRGRLKAFLEDALHRASQAALAFAARRHTRSR
jgi:aminoglycoside phosphotransferase (APT) family kinase protein